MPQPFQQRLDAAAARLHSVARRATASWVAAAALGSAVLIVFLDWLGRYNDPGLRWVFSGTFVAVIGAAAYGAWRRCQPEEATRIGVAQRLQRLRPELGSRLASAVEFAESEASDSTAGSEQLRRAVVLDASQLSDSLPYAEVVDPGPARRAMKWLLAAALLFGAFAAANGSALATGLYRLALPWAEAPWPRLVSLTLVEGPTKIARGGSFEAIAINESGPLPNDIRVEYRYEARQEAAPAMIVADQAVASRDRVMQAFGYRFVGGDDTTMNWTEVAVVDPPVAIDYTVRTQPPAYSGLPTSDSNGPLRVLAGTELAVQGTVDKPLSRATLRLSGDKEIDLTISEDRLSFRNATVGWVAELPSANAAPAPHEIRLAGESGVEGSIGPHRYEVVPDTVPEVRWRSSGDNEVITTKAIVAIAADATDNLALQKIELEWSTPAGAEETEPSIRRDSIDTFGDTPPTRRSLSEGDTASIEYDWDLQPLGLAEGTELSIAVVATDFVPQEGRTTTPKRLLLVSDEEYRSRLGERQSRLLGQVQQALAAQRDALTGTTDLQADARTLDSVDRSQLDRLTSIDFQQREAASQIDDPSTGATRAAEQLLEDLKRSRLDDNDLTDQLTASQQALKQLAEGPLPGARSELAGARRAGTRSAERGASDSAADQEFEQRLEEAIEQQTQAVEQLEQVADLLTSWADFQRFASEAAELEKLERQLAEESQRQAAEAASKLFVGPTQAERDKLVVGQAEAARRFSKLRSAMQRLLASQPEGTERTNAQESVSDALAEADDADLAGKLRDAARSLGQGKLGSAAQAQQQAADGLQSMVEALRRRTTNDPEKLAERLGEEKERLAEIQREVDQLKQRPDTRQTDAARDQAAQKAERLGRRLQRLTASQAASSTQQGAQQTASDSPQQPDQQQEGSQEELAKAQQSFEQAQREIDQRISELENERTERLLEQLAKRIGGYLERQGNLLQETIDLDQEPNQQQVEQQAIELAADQLDLSDELSGYAEELRKRAVFEMALGGAADLTSRAGERLDVGQVDRRTQQLESSALARLRHIKEVLEQKPPAAPENQQQGGGGGQGGNGGQPPPPSPIDVAELKMLRLLQLEVLADTDAYEADTAALRRSGKTPPKGWESAGQELSIRQKQLAELALELAERDNDPETPTAPGSQPPRP